MAGCYGSSKEDRHFEQMLFRHLERSHVPDDDEPEDEKREAREDRRREGDDE